MAEKVLNLRSMVGIQVGAKVLKTIGPADKAQMELHPAGVIVTMGETRGIIPYAALSWIGLEVPKK